jgi:protein-S-isoprenylcysteine O-methyltransferase Ste14
MSALELRVPPLALALLMAGLMWGIHWAWPGAAWVVPWRIPIALLLAGAGLLLALAGVAAFRQARTTVNPTTPGAASAVVTTGVYRWTRNPMYLGFLLALIGWGLLLANPWSLLGWPAFVAYMNRFQIQPEEAMLTAKFGAAYVGYMRQVRRWL